MTRFARRSALARDERGQGLVEFALILPVLLLILVGIIEFGSIYSKVISMRQGVREAGRQGSVANFGSGGCTLNIVGAPPSDHMYDLLCLAKDQAGVGDGVRMYVRFTDKDLVNDTEANCTSVGDAGYPAGYRLDCTNNVAGGNGIMICAIYALHSLTGLIEPLLNHPPRYARTKAVFRIEKLSPTPDLERGGGEKDPSGADWAWCTP